MGKMQNQYDKQYGVGRKKQVGRPYNNLPDNMNLNKNPVIEFGLKAVGGEFHTSDGKNYSPGNPLYERYEGRHHIHQNGDICIGKHSSNIMGTYLLLKTVDEHTFTNGPKYKVGEVQKDRKQIKNAGRAGFNLNKSKGSNY